MRVDEGPVARSSAVAWIAWADDVCRDLRNDPSRRSSWPPLLLGGGGYLEQWKRSDLSAGGTFRWHAEVDPDHLEYLIHGLLQLDAQLAVEVEDGRRPAAPNEGREFYLCWCGTCFMPWRWREQGAPRSWTSFAAAGPVQRRPAEGNQG